MFHLEKKDKSSNLRLNRFLVVGLVVLSGPAKLQKKIRQLCHPGARCSGSESPSASCRDDSLSVGTETVGNVQFDLTEVFFTETSEESQW